MIVSDMVSTIIDTNKIIIIVEVTMGTINSIKAILGKIGGIDKEAEIGMIVIVMMIFSTGKEEVTIEMNNYDVKLI